MSAESTQSADEREPAVSDSLARAIESLHRSAHVECVYGTPIKEEGRTLVPVARVAYGFGGGFGSAPQAAKDASEGASDAEQAGGSSGGGGAMAQPLGVYEISDGGTRFVRAADRKRTALAALFGLVLGYLLGRR